MPKNVQTTIELYNHAHLHANKVMIKILQARLQQYMNWEIPDVQAGFKKGRETKDQIANIHWIIEKARQFQEKNLKNYCFIDCAEVFECMDHNKVWKILKELGIPDPLTCLLWNLYACQQATASTSHWKTDWFKIGKGVHQGYILLPCLFNLCRVGCFLVVQLTLCDPRYCSTPELPIPKHLLKFVQVHVHCIRDAIQPFHPLTPSSPSVLNLSQHQRLF